MKPTQSNTSLSRSSHSEASNLIQQIDSSNIQQATHAPDTLAVEDLSWLQRLQLKRQLARNNREAQVGAAAISTERNLTTMRIAAEGVVKMAEQQWEGLVQLHGARVTHDFATIFLEMQDRFMEEVCTATAAIENRAAAESERIEANHHPEFVKTRARQGNEDRFHKELAAVETIADRIGKLLSTRLNERR
jgi:hypothetical protein